MAKNESLSRDKSLDRIFLNNFFKEHIEIFTREQPFYAEKFLFEYNFATNDWLPLKAEIDTYPILPSMKADLEILFRLAEDYYYYVIAADRSPAIKGKMSELWSKIRPLAINIRLSAKSHKLFSG